MIRFVLGEVTTPDAAIDVARVITELGAGEVDGFGPYPVAGLDEALKLPKSRVPWIVLIGGLTGALGGFYLQWLINGWDYPINVGGRPLLSAPAFIPVTFELGVLFAAISGVLGFLALSSLPRVWHPLFEAPGFERATVDRFFISVRLTDPEADPTPVVRAFEELGARVTVVEVKTTS